MGQAEGPRCLLCWDLAPEAKPETWTETSSELSSTFFKLFDLPLDPYYFQTFKDSSYCLLCLQKLQELATLLDQLTELEKGLSRVKTELELRISPTYFSPMTGQTQSQTRKRKIRNCPRETADMICLRNRIGEGWSCLICIAEKVF
jgi:hypothetical protein